MIHFVFDFNPFGMENLKKKNANYKIVQQKILEDCLKTIYVCRNIPNYEMLVNTFVNTETNLMT